MFFFDAPEDAVRRQTHFDRYARLYRILFVFSGLAMALLNEFSSLTGLLVTVVPKLALTLLAAYRFGMLRYVAGQASRGKSLFAFMLCAALVCQFVTRYAGACTYPIPEAAILPCYIVLGILAAPALFAFSLCAAGYVFDALRAPVSEFIKRMDRIEKIYLIAAFALLAAATAVLFSVTNIFYGASYHGELIDYDVIYTSDSCFIVQSDAYTLFCHWENDLRQPLFALFCLPYSIPAWLLSKLLFFVPNCYAILINLAQAFLICLSALMLARMAEASGAAKIALLALFTVSYPTMLFALNMEQYVSSVFWLILFLYLYTVRAPGRDAFYIAMTGTLITSGAFFPLISDRRPFSAWLKDVLRCALLFYAVVLLFNRQHLFLKVFSQADALSGLAGGQSAGMVDKLLQYVNMLACCLIAPQAGMTTELFAYPSWQLLPVTSVNPVGVAVLALSALGFILNRKKPFARICGAWALLSFALHAIVGWGAYENGLMLYTFYYGWAFLCLIFMGLERLLARLGNMRMLVYAALIAALLVCNIPGMIEIVRFGLVYYPV